jgi:membrane-associated phospholipid phosphatase
LIFIGLHWTEAGIVHTHLHEEVFDAVVMRWDQAVFGLHVQEVWMPAMPYVWLSEAMLFLYFTYYPVVFGAPLLIAARRRREATNDIVFRLFVTYAACFLIYLFFPVEGPKMSMGRMSGPHEAGFFYRLIEGLTEAGDSLGTAFPSSHVAGMTALAIAGYRWFRPKTNAVLTGLAVGMTVSTVYVQHHFAIDALAGVALAAACALVAPALRKALMGFSVKAAALAAGRTE